MQVTGTIIQVLPVQEGQGKNGPWRKQEIIVQTQSQYPKNVCISIWGNKLDGIELKPNMPITCDIELESREYNGRWFTDVKAWRVSNSSAPSQPVTTPSGNVPPPSMDDFMGQDDDVLPF
jgi:hypothetical protein